MEDCTFCQIYEEKKKVKYEDEHFFIQFDAYPVTAGHLEIIPKRHIESVFQLSEAEWKQLQQTLKKAKKLVKDADLKGIYEDFIAEPLDQNSEKFSREIIDKGNWREGRPDAFNIGINEGREAGRTIDHLHIHLIPRYEGDVQNPIGGERNIIPEKADYKSRDTK